MKWWPATNKPTGFRQRLHRYLLPALALTLVVFAVLTFATVYIALHQTDELVLQTEFQEISAAILPGNNLRIQRYHWSEPHHSFASPRIDPFFVQVFGPDSTLLFQTENIPALDSATYPGKPIPSGTFEEKDTGRRFDFMMRPLIARSGGQIGFLQLSRFQPDHFHLMKWVFASLIGLFILTFFLWWILLRRISKTVTSPLLSITEATRSVTHLSLAERISVPEQADAETRQLANTINGLFDRLEHSFDEMQHFTSNAAHELQTPLTLLLGNLDISLRRPRSPESYRETLLKLRQEVEGMIRMVKRLLELARLDQRSMLGESTRINLSALLVSIAGTFESVLDDKEVVLEVAAGPPVFITGHASLVESALRNVIENAVKYTVAGKISVSVQTRDGAAEVVVSDTGAGMSDETLSRIGERFYRAPESSKRSVGGNGLGWALIRETLTREKATWDIVSKPGEGTTVIIRFSVTGE